MTAKRWMHSLASSVASASDVDGLCQHRRSDVRNRQEIPARVPAPAVPSPKGITHTFGMSKGVFRRAFCGLVGLTPSGQRAHRVGNRLDLIAVGRNARTASASLSGSGSINSAAGRLVSLGRELLIHYACHPRRSQNDDAPSERNGVRGIPGSRSIQITVDTYGHLVPGADISWADRLDAAAATQQNATPAQLEESNAGGNSSQRQ